MLASIFSIVAVSAVAIGSIFLGGYAWTARLAVPLKGPSRWLSNTAGSFLPGESIYDPDQQIPEVNLTRRQIANHPNISYAMSAKPTEIIRSGKGCNRNRGKAKAIEQSFTRDRTVQVIGELLLSDFKIEITAINGSHHFSGCLGHRGGWAFDIDRINGVKIDGTKNKRLNNYGDPNVKGLIEWLENNPLVSQVGIPSSWGKELCDGRGVENLNRKRFCDKPGHVHVTIKK